MSRTNSESSGEQTKVIIRTATAYEFINAYHLSYTEGLQAGNLLYVSSYTALNSGTERRERSKMMCDLLSR